MAGAREPVRWVDGCQSPGCTELSKMTIDVEDRMRPGRYSELGFLGADESLEAVLEHDRRTLLALGLTYDEIADALEDLMKRAEALRDKLLAEADGPNAEYYTREHVPWFDPYDYGPEAQPNFSPANLPPPEQGYLVGRHHVFVRQYRGPQECPWECDLVSTDSSLNFLVLDRTTCNFFTFPGLAPHLIRAHQFFEGHGSPFRTDPTELVRVLGLWPGASA